MYSIRLDENGYFTGSYAKVGMVEGGVNLPSLPPTNDVRKSLCYKHGHKTVINITQIPRINEESGEYELDENGEIIYDAVENSSTVLDWIFDEDKYNNLQKEVNEVEYLSIQETIKTLKEENEMLKSCVMELAEIVFG